MLDRDVIGDRMIFAVDALNENEDPFRVPELVTEFNEALKDFTIEFLDLTRTYDRPIGRSLHEKEKQL